MFIKGFISGFILSIINILVLYAVFNKIKQNIKNIFLIILYSTKFVVFALLVFVFLKFHMGNPLGLLGGITLGFLLFYIIWIIKYVTSSGSN